MTLLLPQKAITAFQENSYFGGGGGLCRAAYSFISLSVYDTTLPSGVGLLHSAGELDAGSGPVAPVFQPCQSVLMLKPTCLKKYNFFQEQAPYNKAAFRIEIVYPAEYPFRPPKITFKTKIYHPNVDEKGQVCLPIISADNWKPATKTDQGKLC